MSKDEFIEAVQKVEQQNNQKLSAKDYIEACDELYDYFANCGDAARNDLGDED